MKILTILFLTSVFSATDAIAGDAIAGKAIFKAQCSLCHSAESNDNGGAEGPSLNGVFGRKSAAAGNFGYSSALQTANLIWDAPTLDRFLAAPNVYVPGTTMPLSIQDAIQRADVIAYLQSLKANRPEASGVVAVSAQSAPSDASPTSLTDDWRSDRPGRVHHIEVSQLSAPFDTPSAARTSRVVAKPANLDLKVPDGFSVNVFSTEVRAPRVMKLAPNGDIFLSEPQAGKVVVMRPASDGKTAATISIFAEGLQLPFGIAFYPNATHPRWIYVAETNRVVRYRYTMGDLKARSKPEVVVPRLYPKPGGHYTRDVVFSTDARRMFVSVGSMSNVAEDMPTKTPAEVTDWEAQHGLGAAWATEESRAAVLVYEMKSGRAGPAKNFATGIRNCVGLALQPQSENLWCTTNERDRLGDDLVPDYTTRVKEGGFYGWPWYYIGDHEDPRHAGERSDLKGHVLIPDVLYQSHSAPLYMAFYTATKGGAMFPKEYSGDGFVTMHGSWNRTLRTGHKIVRVRMKNGIPTGEYEDFLTGFIIDDDHVWGRPVGVVVAGDGSLLISDDGNDVIYRVAYSQ